MGRPRKPIIQKKLEGTYRRDRDADLEMAQDRLEAISPSLLNVAPPQGLTSLAAIESWKQHVAFLARLKRLQTIDLPELELMFQALQRARELQEKLRQLEEKGIVENLVDYQKLSTLYLKFSRRFSEIGARYSLSPHQRDKLLLDGLSIAVLENKVSEQSITSKLISKKRA